MHFVLIIIFFVILLYAPGWLAKKTIAENRSITLDNHTGAEFAKLLLAKNQVTGVKVVQTEIGDHYDPQAKSIGLSLENYKGKDLSSLVIACHEVGHAVQDHLNYKPLATRTSLVKWAMKVERIGPYLMYATPILGLFTKSPRLSLISFLLALLIMGTSLVVNLVTLPVELDASFSRAMPMLKAEKFGDKHLESARGILWACALTYFAASLTSLLNVYRWFRVIRK
jgi:Zn-dependent membrane protease YugP